MRDRLVIVIAAAAASAVSLAVILLTPALLPEAAKQQNEVGRLVTRGERLLHSYSAGFAVTQAVEGELAALDAPAHVGEVADLVHAIESGKLVEQIAATIRDLDRAVASATARPPQDRVEGLRQMGYPPLLVENWFSQAAALGRIEARFLQEEYGDEWSQQLKPPTRDLGMGAVQQAEAIRAVWSELQALRNANAAVLDEAEAAARQALALLPGDIRANRLMGTVLSHKAMLKRREAALKAGLATAVRDAVIELAGRVSELVAVDEDYTKRRQLQGSIEQAVARRTELQGLLSEASAEHERLENELQSARTKLSAALAEVQDARAALDALTAEGYDRDRHGPFAAYVQSVEQASASWRLTAAAHQALLEGTITNSRLASAADPLSSPLEPVDPEQPMEVVTGLATIERELAIARDRHELLTTQLQRAEAQVTALQELSQALDAASVRRQEQASALRAELQARVDQEDRLSAEARRAEDDAIEKLAKPARRYFQGAGTGALAAMNAVGLEVGAADRVAADQREYYRSLHAAFIADEAMVLLLEGAVWLQRAEDLEARRDMLDRAQKAGIRELAPEAVEGSAADARQAGLASADEAIRRADAARSKDDQWFYVALTGTGHYQRWLLDQANASDLEQAISLLQEAIGGREETRVAAPYVRVLAGLRTVGGG